MISVKENISDVRAVIKEWKKQGLTIGFVPTMGFLHEGHKSLIRRSAQENDRTVVSIFVNPLQFGPKEDLATYPKDIKKDTHSCEEAGAHLIFCPSAREMYGEGFATCVETTGVSQHLCGAKRPGHFRGVTTVVTKLFNIITPDRSYFGQKDAQQLAVIKQMTRDLNMDIEIIGCPIVREQDGLAMSSRNAYLNKEERAAALCLYKAVLAGQKMITAGGRDAAEITQALKEQIESEPLAKTDYVSIVDARTMSPVKKIEGPVVCAMAVFIGKTRLIDNFSSEV